MPLHSDDELEQLLERRKSNNYLSRIFTRKHYLDTQQCKTLLSYWSDVNCFISAGLPGSEKGADRVPALPVNHEEQ